MRPSSHGVRFEFKVHLNEVHVRTLAPSRQLLRSAEGQTSKSLVSPPKGAARQAIIAVLVRPLRVFCEETAGKFIMYFVIASPLNKINLFTDYTTRLQKA